MGSDIMLYYGINQVKEDNNNYNNNNNNNLFCIFKNVHHVGRKKRKQILHDVSCGTVV